MWRPTMVTIALMTAALLLTSGIVSTGAQQQDSNQELRDMETWLSSSTHKEKEFLRQKRDNDPCRSGNHRIFTDSRRQPSSARERGEAPINDGFIDPGWYRFLLDQENAVMPTSCVPKKHCFTDVTVWLDLEGQSMPEPGWEIQALACGHWYSSCCFWDYPVTVRNCGDFYLYSLSRLHHCNRAYTAAYCMVPENRTVV